MNVYLAAHSAKQRNSCLYPSAFIIFSDLPLPVFRETTCMGLFSYFDYALPFIVFRLMCRIESVHTFMRFDGFMILNPNVQFCIISPRKIFFIFVIFLLFSKRVILLPYTLQLCTIERVQLISPLSASDEKCASFLSYSFLFCVSIFPSFLVLMMVVGVDGSELEDRQ